MFKACLKEASKVEIFLPAIFACLLFTPMTLILAALIGFAPLSAHAEVAVSPVTVTANVGVTSDYVFRGISQTQHKPTLSGGVDLSHANGLYLGGWLSGQKWVKTSGTDDATDVGYKTNSSLEVDLYGGVKGSVGDLGYDLGLIHYYYPGNKVAANVSPDTTEVYLGGSWKTLSVKYSHAISDYFIGWGVKDVTKTRGSHYLEANATHDLGNGWGLIAHVGKQKIKNLPVSDYTDWKVGITKESSVGTITAAWTDTDADPVAGSYKWDGKDVSRGVLALSFSKSF